MTRLFLLGAAGLTLAACEQGPTAETYFCVNGPDLNAIYSDDGVVLQLNDDRDIALTVLDPQRPTVYGAPGVKFSVSGDSARLDIDRKSYGCDKIG